eukprot:scaffold570040_cov295-Attheya_sp.AAC.1
MVSSSTTNTLLATTTPSNYVHAMIQNIEISVTRQKKAPTPVAAPRTPPARAVPRALELPTAHYPPAPPHSRPKNGKKSSTQHSEKTPPAAASCGGSTSHAAASTVTTNE